MTKIHGLKCWKEFFDPLWAGNKTFEMRKDDRDFQIGDSLVLRECEPRGNEFSGREVLAEVTHIVFGRELEVLFGQGMPVALCVMSIKVVAKRTRTTEAFVVEKQL